MLYRYTLSKNHSKCLGIKLLTFLNSSKFVSLTDSVVLENADSLLHFLLLLLKDLTSEYKTNTLQRLSLFQELSQREENMHKMEKSLENYKRKFGVMRHQQGLLYQDYLQDKKVCLSASEHLSLFMFARSHKRLFNKCKNTEQCNWMN